MAVMPICIAFSLAKMALQRDYSTEDWSQGRIQDM